MGFGRVHGCAFSVYCPSSDLNNRLTASQQHHHHQIRTTRVLFAATEHVWLTFFPFQDRLASKQDIMDFASENVVRV